MNRLIELAYYIFSIVWTFKIWGWGWAIVGIFIPVFPLIDLAKYLVNLLT